MSPDPKKQESPGALTVAEMRADLERADLADVLAHFLKCYPHIPEAKAVELLHSSY